MPREFPNASFIRRLAAMVYDFFLILALWLLTGSLLLAAFGEPAPPSGKIPDQPFIATIWLQLICYSEMLLFYVYFWRFKGQSLGMQVWKIRLVNRDNETVSTIHACLRFAIATLSISPLGIGLFWMLLDPGRLTLHDKLSRTRVVYLGDNPYPSEKIDRRNEAL